MRWSNREQSTNIEDRRGLVGPGLRIGGGGLVVVFLIALVTGQNPLDLLNQVAGPGPSASGTYVATEHEEKLKEFTAVTLKDTETVWHDQFKRLGREYAEPKLVVFTQQVQSGCGVADAGVGPFYCPEDQKVYIDLAFYDLMREQFGTKGDFAQAYVIAHEVGHHVQNLLGTMDKVNAARQRSDPRTANQLSVRLELQADFYAGVWAHHARNLASLNEDDLRSALGAANAIGDDTLQRRSQGHVVPDSFTHGTAEQRARWFLKGWESGDIRQGDTFSASRL